MKQEKIVLSFITVVVGLLFAGIVFYLYQTTKAIPSSKIKNITQVTPTPTPMPSVFLTVSSPKDEVVESKKIVSVTGKTKPEATIVIITDSEEQVIKPTSVGDFTTTITLSEGANFLLIKAIGKDGQETSIQKTISYTNEDF